MWPPVTHPKRDGDNITPITIKPTTSGICMRLEIMVAIKEKASIIVICKISFMITILS
ncbi:hypothetical protein RU86_GL000184 [Lactococcus piscium]|uniref:Uncharacterized protein n=1 Tax=Pseudolactococcus piscium TaxID=1364 RepID=A0A2A5S658_9LACT|nr:hypothetical protein RU86_GL000184 [Lactococcus piscium]